MTTTSAMPVASRARVIPLRDRAARDRRTAGGKAASLADLIRAGYPVPAGFVIVAGAAGWEREAVEAFRALGPGARVAVRSSGLDEDTRERSRAGRHETRLGVESEDALLAAVRAIRSGGEPGGMAVLVQVMVEASASGVLFTADPVRGDGDRILVAGRSGAGRVVDGEAAAEAVLLPTGEVVEDRGLLELASRSVIRKLVRLALRIEWRNELPQDIEWAVEEGEVKILQARPLTGLPTALRTPSVDRRFRLAHPGRFSIFGRSLEAGRQRVYDRAVRRWTGRDARTRLLDVEGFLFEAVEWRRRPAAEVLAALRAILPGAAAIRRMRRRVIPAHLARIRNLEERASKAGTAPGAAEVLRDTVGEALAFQSRSLEVALAVERFPLEFLRAARALAPGWDARAALAGAAEVTRRRDMLLRRTADPDVLREVGYLLVPGNPRDPGRAGLAEPDPTHRPGPSPDSPVPPAPIPGPLHVRLVLGHLLRLARLHLPFREEKNHVFDRGAWAIRHALKVLGERLSAEGILPDTKDAALLTLAEATDLPRDWRRHFGRIALDLPRRRTAERRAEGLEPPSRILPRPTRRGRSDRALSGAAGAPGTAEGNVRVVRGPGDFARVREGDIMVVPRLRPFMSSLLSRAAGLVAEEGTALSHGATLAREYGVPAVVGIVGATDDLAEGEVVRVLGSDGEVVRVRD